MGAVPLGGRGSADDRVLGLAEKRNRGVVEVQVCLDQVGRGQGKPLQRFYVAVRMGESRRKSGSDDGPGLS